MLNFVHLSHHLQKFLTQNLYLNYFGQFDHKLIVSIKVCIVKFMYSENATKFCKISTVDLSYVVPVKSTVEISQNFVAFSEYMNFTNGYIFILLIVFENNHLMTASTFIVSKIHKKSEIRPKNN